MHRAHGSTPRSYAAQAGLNAIAAAILADLSHVAIGTGTTAATVSDTTLETETDRNANSKETQTGASVEIRALFTNAELPAQVEEVGTFDAGASGDMYTRELKTYAKSGGHDLLLVQFLQVREGS